MLLDADTTCLSTLMIMSTLTLECIMSNELCVQPFKALSFNQLLSSSAAAVKIINGTTHHSRTHISRITVNYIEISSHPDEDFDSKRTVGSQV